jgi:hypothetical protein
MKHKLCGIMMFTLLSACGQSAVKKGAFKDGPAVTLAVLPLQNNSGDSGYDATGGKLAEMITTRLATRPGIRVVERARLEQIFAENKLALTGAVDQATAVKLGRLLGANVMAFGGFSNLGGEARLNMRLVKVETGEIVGGVLEEGKTLVKLDAMADEAARALADGIEKQEAAR